MRHFEGEALGIDPGVARVGVARVRYSGRRWCLVNQPFVAPDDVVLTHMALSVYDGIRLVAVENVADVMPKVHQGFGSLQMLEVVGAARLLARIHGAAYERVHPKTWRKAITGSGNATKEQVRAALRVYVDGWQDAQVPLDASDAVAIAIAAAMRMR